jgi:hypothetical protein
MTSEKNSELSELTSEKNSELSELTSEKNSELSELTSEKIQNSELRSETTTLIRKILSDSEIIPS